MLNVEQSPGRGIGKIVGIVGLVLVSAACACPVLFVGFPWVDASICVPRAAQRIGVQATYNDLYQYVDQHIVPGKTRAEVVAILEQIGPVQIQKDVGALPESSTDYVRINMCLDPRN